MAQSDFGFSLSENSVNEINGLIEQYSQGIIAIMNEFQDDLIEHISTANYDKLLKAVDGIIELYNNSVRYDLKTTILDKWQEACESMSSFAERMDMGEESEQVASEIEEVLSSIFDAGIDNRLHEVDIDGRTSASIADFDSVNEIFDSVVKKVQELSDEFSEEAERLGEDNEFYKFIIPVVIAYSSGICSYFRDATKNLESLEDNYISKMAEKREAVQESKQDVDLSSLMDFSDLTYAGMGTSSLCESKSSFEKGLTHPKSKSKNEESILNKIKDHFEGSADEAQFEFNDYMRKHIWNDPSISNQDKIKIMMACFERMTPKQKRNFNIIGDYRIIRNSDYSDWGNGQVDNYWPDIDWPDFPGLDGESECNPPKSVIDSTTQEVIIPRHLDRIGSSSGQNLGVVEEEWHCSQDERSIAYIDNPYARNDYTFEGKYYKEAIDAIKNFDLDNPEETIERLNKVIKKNNELNGDVTPLFINDSEDDIGEVLNMKDTYDKFQRDCEKFCKQYEVDSSYGLLGVAKKWEINGEIVCKGGAGQINVPIAICSLERLGILKCNGGW